jgi:DNA-binding NarL/FixJ family response regulator
MLTNFSHDQLVTEALGRGAVDYILKYQISHEDLVKKVKEIIGDN